MAHDNCPPLVTDEKCILKAEWDHIMASWNTRRHASAEPELSPEARKALSVEEHKSLRGLALSGGGIRSAAFAIGALQALNKGYVLGRVHYLSTVSGGGYAGSALTWLFAAQNGKKSAFDTAADFPLSLKVQGSGGGSMTDALRHKASYLEPGAKFGKIALAAIVLRSIAISVLAYFLLLTTLLYLVTPWLIEGAWHRSLQDAIFPSGGPLHQAGIWLKCWPPVVTIGIAAVIGILIWYLLSNLAGAVRLGSFHLRQSTETILPHLFALAIGCFGLASLPFLLDAISAAVENGGWIGTFGRAAATLGPIVAVGGSLSSHLMLRNSGASDKNMLAGALLWVSGLVLIMILALSAFALVKLLGDDGNPWLWKLLTLAGVTLAVGGVSNLNYTGLHRFYRDRLMQAFMPNRAAVNGQSEDPKHEVLADKFALHQACAPGTAGPYHLINCNVVLTSSSNSKYFSRGGDSFVLSRLYCGSTATHWQSTGGWISGGKSASPWPWRFLNIAGLQAMRPMTLATAMAISGAAVNPRTTGQGPVRSGLLSFVSTLFNIRLGYWVPNPHATSGGKRWIAWYPPNFLHPGVMGGLFSKRKNERARWVELSDGGHFDNIGLYELVRRRVKYIIVIDGTADPDLKLSSFANAYERARNDFGVKIDISSYPANFNDMMPETARPESSVKAEHLLAERGFAIGTITYPKIKDTDPEEEKGFLFYVNTVLTERLPANLYSYHAEHPSFPDEPTSDQFFDEQQFEAYRELGMEITWDMLRSVALYKDLAKAVGLTPTDGDIFLGRGEVKPEISSPDLIKDFARQFPSKKRLSIPEYRPDPDVLDWPPPKNPRRPVPKKPAGVKFARKVAAKAKRRRSP